MNSSNTPAPPAFEPACLLTLPTTTNQWLVDIGWPHAQYVGFSNHRCTTCSIHHQHWEDRGLVGPTTGRSPRNGSAGRRMGISVSLMSKNYDVTNLLRAMTAAISMTSWLAPQLRRKLKHKVLQSHLQALKNLPVSKDWREKTWKEVEKGRPSESARGKCEQNNYCKLQAAFKKTWRGERRWHIKPNLDDAWSRSWDPDSIAKVQVSSTRAIKIPAGAPGAACFFSPYSIDELQIRGEQEFEDLFFACGGSSTCRSQQNHMSLRRKRQKNNWRQGTWAWFRERV